MWLTLVFVLYLVFSLYVAPLDFIVNRLLPPCTCTRYTVSITIARLLQRCQAGRSNFFSRTEQDSAAIIPFLPTTLSSLYNFTHIEYALSHSLCFYNVWL